MHVHRSNLKYAFHAANPFASALGGKKTLMAIGPWWPYVAANYEETKENSSTIAMGADGLHFTTADPATDEDDITTASKVTATIAADKVWTMTARLYVSHATSFGFVAGFVTSTSTVPGSSAPADGVYFIKVHDNAGLTGRVIENSQAADDLTSFNDSDGTASAVSLVAGTFVELGIKFKAGDSASDSWGQWIVNGYVTQMTANQVTAIYTMLATTAATLRAILAFRVNGTTQRYGVVDFALFEVDA